MKKVTVKLYGGFKKYIPQGTLEIFLSETCSANQFKIKIQEYLVANVPDYNEPTFVFDSVLATENEVLNDESALIQGEHYALLPPVCGG